MLKHWKINAKQNIDVWWMPNEGNVYYEFKDFKLSFYSSLKVTEKGYIRPVIYGADLDFGYSYLHHENEFLAFVSYTFLEFGTVCMENAVYFWGKFLWSRILGPILSFLTNDY